MLLNALCQEDVKAQGTSNSGGDVSEHTEQVALFNWCKLMEGRHPQMALIFSIPNGGHRHIAVARKLKKEGVKSGIPDIFLSVPKNDKHGMFIEMKHGKNKPSESQLEWLGALSGEGYETAICYGFDDARDAIIKYLGIETA
tara:strand:- start:891 stop:1316 length:426 start_codon:yes stop_codon:yes gene_type:complete